MEKPGCEEESHVYREFSHTSSTAPCTFSSVIIIPTMIHHLLQSRNYSCPWGLLRDHLSEPDITIGGMEVNTGLRKWSERG